MGEMALLEQAIEEIMAVARDCGLDPFEMRFELVPAEVMYAFGAYGMPTRFSHWSFGKAYFKIKTEHDYNLSRIYEMVINTDPCYAFLLEGNSLFQNKLVVAHVLGHSDFFKHNAYFQHTPRNMLETMAASAERIRGYELAYGRDVVEAFLDAVLALQEHVNPYRFIKETPAVEGGACAGCRENPYRDLWGEYGECEACSQNNRKAGRPDAEKDLLLFILQHAADLQDWQRDILGIIRGETLYFWPQMQTKIINEGWATYWHTRIMRAVDLAEDEAVEYARTHAGIVQPYPLRVNPYLLGLKVFEDIEARWGREAIFEVRSTCDDISFLRNYLTEDVVKKLDLYVYRRIGQDWRIADKAWTTVRDVLVGNLVNCGFPYIVVEDGDYGRRGELYLRHCYEGVELDVYHLERTLPYVFRLWGRPVHLETVLEGRTFIFSYGGERVLRRTL